MTHPDENRIIASGLVYAYPDAQKNAVDDVSMRVKSGEFLAILGHNGSGKSTLAKLFNALYIPTDGTVWVCGMDTRDDDLVFDIRQHAGMVFQNPDNQIVATVVEEDVAFGLENNGVPPKEICVRIDEALRAVNMSEFSKKAPHMLSGGQKQRVAIAGVLAMKPDVIILDESTAMLDPSGRREVMNTVHRLNDEEGISVVIITHYMAEAATADYVIVMDEGRIAMSGTPREVFRQVDRVRALGLDVPPMTYVYMPGGPYETQALHDISLTIEDGEFVGLIGHTGSGKSTLVQHLNGLITPTSGRVVVDGLDLSDKQTDKRAVRCRVGLVFQYPENQLFEETVEKDIAFGPKNLGLPPEEIDRRVRDAMRRVALDYETLHNRSVFELSGGQMRRAAIAGVLAMEPQVLVLDEPCAGLDPRGREEILGLIRALHRESGATIVMVSHSMEDVASLAERVIVMDHGRVVMDGAPRDVFSRGEELRSIGLDVPQAVELASRLRSRGLEIPQGAYRMEEIRAAILAAVGKGGRHA